MEKADNFKNNNEGYLQEIRVELGGNAGARSISSMSQNRENDGNEYAEGLLEKILDRDNMNVAYRRVKKNKGSHGVDGMTVDELLPFLKQNGRQIKQSIREGTYRPKPVRRVEIPKPDGGIRLLGIPTVLDRVIQQAISQVLSPIYEEQFSENSYGFRPNRSAHQAVKKCGVMINGVVMETEEGTPQGGNLSPLLSNIMLNELDKELTKRGLKFCRYADDCNIYVKSRKAADRVMVSITRFIEGKLKLKVNKEKSSVDRPWRLKFLGFSFYCKKGGVGIRVHLKPVEKLKRKLKEITGRSNAMSMRQRMLKLTQAITGWVNYFSLADMGRLAKSLDEWLRRRIRMCVWKQWKKIRTRYANLCRLGIRNSKALEFANTRKSYWRISNSPILSRTVTNEYLKKLGLQSIVTRYSLVH